MDKKKGGIHYLEANSASFNHLISSLSLVDIETTNKIFTWNSKQGGSNQMQVVWIGTQFQKILFKGGWRIEETIIPSTGSDHWSIFLETDVFAGPKNKPFKFKKFWLTNANIQ